jgi:hypothetical protein
MDGDSSYLSRIKVPHKKLTTEGQLFLTMFRLMHLNTYVSWRITSGLDYLMSPLCTSFKSYRNHLNLLCGTFRQFLMKQVSAMTDAAASSAFMGSFVEPAPEPGVTNDTAPERLPQDEDSPKINIAMNSNHEMSRIARMSGARLSLPRMEVTYLKDRHVKGIIDSKSGRTCVMCCSFTASAEIHNRLGNKTKRYCIECKVHLCNKKRWTREGVLVDVSWSANTQLPSVVLSCHDLYHGLEVLPVIQDACCKIDGVMHNVHEVARPPKIPRRNIPNQEADSSAVAASVDGSEINLQLPPALHRAPATKRKRSTLGPTPRVILRKSQRAA